jgi:uncharacterized phage protein (TIGR01671 family)
MREIRFRAWVKEVHENGEFAYGGYMINPHELKSLLLGGVTSLMTGPRGVGIEYYVTGSYPLPMFGSLEFMRSDEIEIMQYTGLKDREGKEVYDGDILDCTSELLTNFGHTRTGVMSTTLYKVIWRNEGWGKRILRSKQLVEGAELDGLEITLKYAVVIGNIYEHPHLLEEAK